MPKINCEINFDGDTFYNGQMVAGHVNFAVNERIKVQRIVLQVRGLATCYVKESLLFSSIELLRNKKELRKGNNKFDFNFILPSKLPSSIKGKTNGTKYEIQYEAVVYLIRLLRFDLKFHKKFNVLSGFNLKLLDDLNVPITRENNEIIATLYQRGFVVGDEVLIRVQIKNPDDDDAAIVCTLVRQNSYNFTCEILNLSRSKNEKIYEKTVFSPKGRSTSDIIFRIPEHNGPPSTVDPYMKTINVQYVISIVVPKRFFFVEAPLEFPVIFGLMSPVSELKY